MSTIQKQSFKIEGPKAALEVTKNVLTPSIPLTCLILGIGIMCGGCARGISRKTNNNAIIEMKNYNKVSFEILLSDPSAFDNQLIEVEGIYSGLRKFGPVLYKDEQDFKTSNYKHGIFILNQSGPSVFVNVQHGKPVVVRGKLRLPQKDEANVYYAEIIEVCSVVGKRAKKGQVDVR